MAIAQDEIEKIAELARIRIAAPRIAAVTDSIAAILALVDELQTVDTENTEPMAHPLDATAVLRADAVTETDCREQFQALAPAVEDGLYLVPKVID